MSRRRAVSHSEPSARYRSEKPFREMTARDQWRRVREAFVWGYALRPAAVEDGDTVVYETRNGSHRLLIAEHNATTLRMLFEDAGAAAWLRLFPAADGEPDWKALAAEMQRIARQRTPYKPPPRGPAEIILLRPFSTRGLPA
jgi:hypothetical protein